MSGKKAHGGQGGVQDQFPRPGLGNQRGPHSGMHVGSSAAGQGIILRPFLEPPPLPLRLVGGFPTCGENHQVAVTTVWRTF